MRVRLTIGVGLVTAVFLGLAAFLFGQRASELVLAGVRADQLDAPATIGASLGPYSADRAADVYRELERAGKLGQFWQVLQLGELPIDATVVIVDDSPMTPSDEPGPAPATSPVPDAAVEVVGGAGGATEVRVAASTVLGVGEALLAGLSPTDLLVVSGQTVDTGTDTAPAPGVVDVAATAIPVGNVISSVDGIEQDLWLAACVLTLLAAAATWVLTGRALRPVEAITRRVEDITAAGSGDRVPEPADRGEIGHLARTVNTMLDRLDRSAVTQRRFVADASHELRSPLAVIRTEAEVALAHPDRADWEATARTVLEETGRLEGLVSDLLVLARHDDGHRPAAGGVTDVDEVVLAEAARARRVAVDTGGVLGGRVAAPPGDVARVVRHLLDNAARHAAARVQVTVRPDGDRVVLVVDDDGAGVPEADRTRIFERFARLEESRSRDAGGVGLGLAVVAAIVESLGGDVTVGDAPIGGARFVVRLPAAG